MAWRSKISSSIEINILFVDDMPEFKIYSTIKELKEKNIDFTYEIVGSLNSACRYLKAHENEIDLVILDLGLPFFDNGDGYGSLNGLKLVDEIFRRKIKVPIIINSTTQIPNEEQYLKRCPDNTKIQHVHVLEADWLIEFFTQI